MSFIHPRIGVGVFIVKRQNDNDNTQKQNPTFIMGKRQGSHGAGTWALPGGHLEFGESFETCAAREVLEETGLVVKNLRFLTATNDVMTEVSKHYVTVFMVCEREDEGVEPEILEPDKCLQWKWVEWNEMLGWAQRQLRLQQHNQQISALSSSSSSPSSSTTTATATATLTEAQDLDHPLFSSMVALTQQRADVRPELV